MKIILASDYGRPTVRPHEIKEGMAIGDDQLWYVATNDALRQGSIVTVYIQWVDGGMDRRDWDYNPEIELPLIDDADKIPGWLK